ncbi:hypothetical protein [Spirosoma pomorum]|jgi:hypothetical protein
MKAKLICMRLTYLIVLFLVLCLSCSKEELALNGRHVKARVLYNSCAGTVIQWVQAPTSKGKEWLWFTNLGGPFDQSNPAKTYPDCVTAFDIPFDRLTVNDTIEFSYQELSSPPEVVCAIGGLPANYISVKGLKSK